MKNEKHEDVSETVSEKTTSKKPSSSSRSKKTRTVSNKDSAKATIEDFVSSTGSNIYAITGLPEEFIATLFAWVSRSPKSFKEHLESAIRDFKIPKPATKGFEGLNAKAKAFHEKWTVGYGHSSVGEHAVIHMALEHVSRLASAELELASQFLSITEYSQRYQRPKRGDWVNPFTDEAELLFEDYMNEMYTFFEQLQEVLYDEAKSRYMKVGDGYGLSKQNTEEAQKKINKDLKALEKKAFEDARYVLPLAMHTQLGVTANARAWREVIANMANSKHQEIVDCATALRNEASKVTPVLLRHVDPSQYQHNMKIRKAGLYSNFSVKTQKEGSSAKVVHTLSESTMLKQLLALTLMEEKNISYEEAMHFATNQKDEQFQQMSKVLLHEMDVYDNPPSAFKALRVNAILYISEANWHQLLRHNRGADFTYGKPSMEFGYRVPPAIRISEKANKIFEEAMEYAEGQFEVFQDETGLAEYAVTNAHIRPVYMSVSLYEMYHLINLRTSNEAQWDIRESFTDLFKELHETHPFLISMAPRRNPEIIPPVQNDTSKGGDK